VIVIRKAGIEDSFAISAVLRQSFAEYQPQYTAEAFAVTTPKPAQMLVRMKEGPVWVCELQDRITGTVSAVLKAQGLYVRGMAVLPEARGRKMGWRMLEHVEEFAASEGLGSLFLSTTPFLHRAIRLYEHFGFHRTEQGPHDLCGTPLFTMVKSPTVAPHGQPRSATESEV
jgi:ribosomal protein S18 acetylase RimI-like enzyme